MSTNANVHLIDAYSWKRFESLSTEVTTRHKTLVLMHSKSVFYRLGRVATFLQGLQWTPKSRTHQSLISTFAVMLAFRLELIWDQQRFDRQKYGFSILSMKLNSYMNIYIPLLAGNQQAVSLPCALGRQPLFIRWAAGPHLSALPYLCALHPVSFNPSTSLLCPFGGFSSSLSLGGQRAWQVKFGLFPLLRAFVSTHGFMIRQALSNFHVH